MVEPVVWGDDLHYDETIVITRENLREPLTRNKAAALLTRVCAKAEEMNADADSPYTIRRIYLYGSCLRDAEKPHDIDLGIEIRRKDDTPVPAPHPYPFGSPDEFQTAARPLALRKPRLISLHHMEEVRSIGAPHRLIWESGRGRLQDEPLQTPTRTSETAPEYTMKRQRHAVRQQELDSFVRRVQTIREWPVMPKIAPSAATTPTLEQYRAWQKNRILLARFHLHCLPEGVLRKELQAKIDAQLAKSPDLSRQWQDAAAHVLPFIRASQHHTPWHPRPDGRLVKRR